MKVKVLYKSYIVVAAVIAMFFIITNFVPPIHNLLVILQKHTPFLYFISYAPFMILQSVLEIVFENDKGRWNIAKSYFKKYDEEKAPVRYKNMKNMLYITTAIVIIYITTFFFLQKSYFKNDILLTIASFVLVIILTWLVSSSLKFYLARKEFAFYFAKTYAKISSNIEDEYVRARYLILALEWYNKYIQYFLHMQFKNPDKIYDKIIMFHDTKINDTLIISMIDSSENNTLVPLRCIKNFYETQNTKQVLIREQIGQKIKDSSTATISIITVIIAILGLFLKK